MADLLIKGISDISAPHDIHITNVGLNGVKEAFKAWDSAAGCVYEVVEVPPHGLLIDEDAFRESILKAICEECDDDCKRCKIKDVLTLLDYAPTIIGASEDGEQDE